jgi:tyrosinase
MSDSAQRMVDVFLGAAVPKEENALAGTPSATFRLEMDAEAVSRRPFSIFVPGDEERAAELASRMATEATALAGESEDDIIARILQIAAEAAPGLPAGTAEYALKLFVTHNPAARNLRVPNLMSRMSPSPAEALVSLRLSDDEEILSEIGGRSTPEEDRVAWFREDPVANEHHEHWHLVYPLSETKDRAVIRRRGEMFFYMHQQMLARFDAERLAAKLERVQAYDDYDQAIEVGYDVGALEIDRRKFPVRAHNSTWKDMPLADLYGPSDGRTYRIEDHEARRDRFFEAAGKKELHDPGGTPVALDGHQGTNHLGNTNESSSATASVSQDGRSPRDALSHYGNHHGFGHILVSKLGMTGANDWGLMFFPAANIRDPFFWRWHKHVDNINFTYQEQLPAHDFADAPLASFGGGDDQGIVLLETGGLFDALPRDGAGDYLTSLENFVQTALGNERFSDDAAAAAIDFKLDLGGGTVIDSRIETVAELRTEMRQGVFELFDPELDGKKFRYPYLWHRPFHYAIRLRNLADTEQRVTVRLFLCPASDADGNPDDSLLNDRRLWIEMDKFTPELGAGEDKIVVRDDRESSVIRRPVFEPEHVTDIHYPMGNPHEEGGFCECGWPYHLLVPRGSEAGMRFALLAVLTKDRLPDQGGCGSMSFCGVKDEYPDPRPMGYPFDRPLAKPLIELARDEESFALRFITIRHEA